MYVMFELNFPGMKLVKSELRLHGVVENHTYIENRLLLEKELYRIPLSIYSLVVVLSSGLKCYHTTFLQHSILNSLI